MCMPDRKFVTSETFQQNKWINRESRDRNMQSLRNWQWMELSPAGQDLGDRDSK